jgi:predicted glycoside hydrolase/deacetylase ChbG (UPF0249 family)
MFGLAEKRIALRYVCANEKRAYDAAQSMINKLVQAEKDTGIDVTEKIAEQRLIQLEAISEYNRVERIYINTYPEYLDEILEFHPRKLEEPKKKGKRYASSNGSLRY